MPRYDQCDNTCTTDCGHCKGADRPTVTSEFGTTGHQPTRVELTHPTDALHQEWPRVAYTPDVAWILGRFLAATDRPEYVDLWRKLRLAKYATDPAERVALLQEIAAHPAADAAFTLVETADEVDQFRDQLDAAGSDAQCIEIDGYPKGA